MKFKPGLAPITAAIFPLINKDGLPEIAIGIYEKLRQKYTLQYDAKQSIGKRYARMDEAGTPFCFTVDGDTPQDHSVTVRDRDTADQTRIAIDRIEEFLDEKLNR
jgi:glycyl-tRNA synthetase